VEESRKSTTNEPASGPETTPTSPPTDPDQEEEQATPCGFRAVATASQLTSVFEPVARLVDECRLHASNDGVEITAVDAAMVGMVQVDAGHSMFHSLAADCTLGIPLDRLLNVLAMAESDDSIVQFSLDEHTRKLDIVVDDLEFSLTLIDPDTIRKEPEIPDLNLPATATVQTNALKRGIQAAGIVDGNCSFEADAATDSLTFHAAGTSDRVDYELTEADELEAFAMADPRTHDTDSEYSFTEPDGRPDDLAPAAVKSTFSLDYLQDVRQVLPADSTVEVSVGTEYPVRVAFALADGGVDVEYLLAPQITT
jgi:proliferating cell nuclear antigen